MIADEGNDQASNQAELLLRAAVRLIAPRSAAASGRRLTGLHPHAPALLRQCFHRNLPVTVSVYRKT
ncbi:hypothetical protein HCH04_11205 [Bacteroides thetaiotaomicron]|uniref:hypothetical protein n=1 Tax=Bacteroides thetaiotaomicron TaxID=818 RepID=UPI001248E1C0|nr:hypothetical protein [Bacteroides thetaiotaomicron]MBX9048890.1 hypothetical protein [Bacteroides thetaiotaomicron]MBX9071895.1 hypothetical protein [Bacteroides thetaiotaomicron]MCA6005152.1 hypothetical protein [Bacteroides thetaiotaomicron]MCS2744456.1 hypothetical protein [Bacteroides thetaiotaomicron]MDC2257612.1 hypothetical protein [Bacteroides thetaiotaomicron]